MIINEGTNSYKDRRVGMSIAEQICRYRLKPGDRVFWGHQMPSSNPNETVIQMYSARIKRFKVHPIWIRRRTWRYSPRPVAAAAPKTETTAP